MSWSALKTQPKKLALAIAMAVAGSANVSAMPLLEMTSETINVSGNTDATPPGSGPDTYDSPLTTPPFVSGGASSNSDGFAVDADASSEANTGGGYRARADVRADSFFGALPATLETPSIPGTQSAIVGPYSGLASASVLFSQTWENKSTGEVDVDLSFLIDNGRLSVDDFSFFPEFENLGGPFAAGVGGFSGTASYLFNIKVELPNNVEETLLSSEVAIDGIGFTANTNGLGSGDGENYSWDEQFRETMFSLGVGEDFTFTADLTVSATGMLDESCLSGMNGVPMVDVSYYGDGCGGYAFAGNGDPLSIMPQLEIDAMAATVPPGIPEPGTLALLGISAAAAAGSRRKRRR